MQAIQHNLDWVWPYWVVRQFDPKDVSFIPRAFSLTHINLTHRNWTAAGIPDYGEYPLVDPRGLRTPFYDGWSLDAWIIQEGQEGESVDLLPPRAKAVSKKWDFEEGLSIHTRITEEYANLFSQVSMETVEYLLKNHFVNGGFFHEMSHSGINPYLTLTAAQILLRNQDARYAEILRALQKLASPTGQWPEAIHPQTRGGCMGDGQHVWASAEWILMVRNCFVREEGEKLIFCSGILPEWQEGAGEIFFGPTPTSHGNVTIRLRNEGGRMTARWESDWRKEAPEIEIRLPGCVPRTVPRGEFNAVLSGRQAV